MYQHTRVRESQFHTVDIRWLVLGTQTKKGSFSFAAAIEKWRMRRRWWASVHLFTCNRSSFHASTTAEHRCHDHIANSHKQSRRWKDRHRNLAVNGRAFGDVRPSSFAVMSTYVWYLRSNVYIFLFITLFLFLAVSERTSITCICVELNVSA